MIWGVVWNRSSYKLSVEKFQEGVKDFHLRKTYQVSNDEGRDPSYR